MRRAAYSLRETITAVASWVGPEGTFVFVGGCALTLGAAQFDWRLGPVVGGVLLLAYGILIARPPREK